MLAQRVLDITSSQAEASTTRESCAVDGDHRLIVLCGPQVAEAGLLLAEPAMRIGVSALVSAAVAALGDGQGVLAALLTDLSSSGDETGRCRPRQREPITELLLVATVCRLRGEYQGVPFALGALHRLAEGDLRRVDAAINASLGLASAGHAETGRDLLLAEQHSLDGRDDRTEQTVRTARHQLQLAIHAAHAAQARAAMKRVRHSRAMNAIEDVRGHAQRAVRVLESANENVGDAGGTPFQLGGGSNPAEVGVGIRRGIAELLMLEAEALALHSDPESWRESDGCLDRANGLLGSLSEEGLAPDQALFLHQARARLAVALGDDDAFERAASAAAALGGGPFPALESTLQELQQARHRSH